MQSRVCLFLIGMVCFGIAKSQTNPPAQGLPYFQDFGSNSFTVLPAGLAVWNGLSGTTINSQSLAEASNATGNATITARTTSTSIGGAYGLVNSTGGKLYIQSSSNASEGVNQFVLAFNTGHASKIRISYSIEVIEAGTGRSMGSVLQYRKGSAGTWLTVPGSGMIYNNSSTNGGDNDSNGDADDFSYELTGLILHTDYQVRWAHWRSGSAGNSVGLAYDDISICGIPDVYQVTGGGVYCAGGSGMAVGVDDSQQGVFYQLTLNGNSMGLHLPGNGETISFGHQVLEGSYSVTAYFPGSCSVEMNGAVDLTSQLPPTISHAGIQQDLCGTSTTVLSANIPERGIGWWSQQSGEPAIIEDPLSHHTSLQGLKAGLYSFRWTIAYGVCPPSESEITIIVAAPLVHISAGEDHRTCGLATLMDAEIPHGGEGLWTKLSGPGEVMFEDESKPNSQVSVSKAGEYIFKWTVSNECSEVSDEVKIIFNQAPALQVNHDNMVLMYGQSFDPLIISATDPDSDLNELVVASSWKFNNGIEQDELPGAFSLEALVSDPGIRQWKLVTNGSQLGIGKYEIIIKVTDDCGEETRKTIPIEITANQARPQAEAFYTGSCFFWTNHSNSKSATLHLAATLKNAPGTLGDIRTAKLSFYIREGNSLFPISGAQNLQVGLVNQNDMTIGSASANVQFNIGTANASVLNIAVLISGNYAANDPATDKSITIAVPVPGGQICGGLEILPQQTAGLLAAAPGSMINTAFFVQFNNSLKNPQGKVEFRFSSYNDRNGVKEHAPRNYIVRTNSISGLSLAGTTAHFSAKANLSEIIHGVEVPLEGNCLLQLHIADGELALPFTGDRAAITLYRNKGGIWLSSNWNGTTTVLQEIHSGNLAISGSGSEAKILQKEVEIFNEHVTVYPNPSSAGFTIKLNKEQLHEHLEVIIRDLAGREIKRYSFQGQRSIYFGSELIKGMYLVEMIQRKKRIKFVVVKQ